jgi:hypothetical protein
MSLDMKIQEFINNVYVSVLGNRLSLKEDANEDYKDNSIVLLNGIEERWHR